MAENKEKRFKLDITYRIFRIKHLGKKHGWKLMNETEQHLCFYLMDANRAPKVILTIDYLTFDIETILKHPVKGPTKLIRQGDFTMAMIEKIFTNPRAHTPGKIKTEYLPFG